MADRMQLLKEIDEVSFFIHDMMRYLDTHPVDAEDIRRFSEAAGRRKELLKEYAREFEPLSPDSICPDRNDRPQFAKK